MGICYYRRKRPPRRAPVPRGSGKSSRDRRMIQTVICGGVFVLLVVLKLLFPRGIAGLAGRAEELLTRDADFRAAFSAVGRAIAGEEEVSDSLEEAYTAVFAPDHMGEEGAAGGLAAEEMSPSVETGAGEEAISPVEGAAGPEVQQAIGPEETEQTESAEEQTETVSGSYTFFSMPLPEGVSMDQVVLGFDCCTPVEGAMTSAFGWREHPVYGEDRFHYGLDLGAEQGAAVAAFAEGTVTAVGESSALGKYLMIGHEGGFTTLYAHCSKIIATSGREVAAGEKIAEVGSTGISTGPHLHFELHRDGVYLNPIYYVEIH